MPKPTDINAYLTSVCDQIRWKKARDVVSQELENHITDQADTYIKDGLDEKSAIESAIEEMGDPVVVGEQLDRVHRPRPDWVMLGVTALLVVIGGVLLYYILSQGDPMTMISFRHYLFYLLIGVIALVTIYFVDYSIIGKYPKTLFIAFLAVCACVVFLGPRIRNVTYAQLDMPSVFNISLLLIPLFAGVAYNQRGKRYGGLLVCLAFYVLAAALSLRVYNGGGLILFSIAFLILMTVTISRNWFPVNKPAALAINYVPVVLLLFFIVMRSNAFRQRLFNAFFPHFDPMGYWYQGAVIRSILSGVKLWGTAQVQWPDSLPNFSGLSIEHILPSWNSDLMLTYLMYKFGAIVGIVLTLAILALIVRLFIVVSRQKSALGFAVSLSVALAITLQSAFYILGNFGVLLFSSSLPLLSYGGVGLAVNMALIGLALSAFRRNDIVKDSLAPRVVPEKRIRNLLRGKIVD